MKPAPLLAGLVVGIVAGCAIGFFVGRFERNPPAAGDQRESAEASRSPRLEETGLERRETTRTVTATSEAGSIATSPEGASAPPRSLAEQLRDIAAMKSHIESMYFAEQLFTQLSLAELPATFADMQTLPVNAKRAMMLGALFRRWGALDAPAALAAAQQLNAREKWSAESCAFEGWAKTDPARAWEAAREKIASTRWRVSA